MQELKHSNDNERLKTFEKDLDELKKMISEFKTCLK